MSNDVGRNSRLDVGIDTWQQVHRDTGRHVRMGVWLWRDVPSLAAYDASSDTGRHVGSGTGKQGNGPLQWLQVLDWRA